jgi:hypothetical protein
MYDTHRMYVEFIKNLRRKNISEGKILSARRDFSNWIKQHLMSREQLEKYRVETFFDVEENIEKWQNYYTEKPSDCPDDQWPIFRQKDKVDKREYGWGPLHRAIMDNDLEKVKELISEGADIKMIDNGGNTPFEIAVLEDREEIVDYFLTLNLEQAQ